MSNLEPGRAMRRAVLGDTYVDAQTAAVDDAARDFQDYVTETAWGVWARNDILTPRDRSLLVLSMTAALGRMEEFELHLRSQPRTGVTDAEVDELVFQITAYCGVPAGVAARRATAAVRAEHRTDGEVS
jgi:4-carboxymuconolactone decarboxylase